MAKVDCEVEEVYLENDYGNDVDGVRVKCGRCGHEVDSFGTSSASIRRCLVLLREECPEGEANYYTADGADD